MKMIIQSFSTNIFGKVDREYMAYDFAGNVTKRKVVHGKPGTTSTFTETLTYTFDAMGRPLKTTHKAGTATSRTVVKRSYDPVGRLSSLSRINPPVAALTQTYSYNIRSWLTGIGGSLFSEELDYSSGDSPRWDGKISAIRWKNPSETAWRSYGYAYDSLSRLTDAEYDESGRSGAFSEHYGYDLNGNMRTRSAERPVTGTAGTEVIALSTHPYSYSGNRMVYSGLDSLTYDACGRLTGSSDGHVRSTEYNEIGLPKSVTIDDGTVVSTVYAADGRKLRETVTTGSTVTMRHYSGSCIFEGNTLKKVLFEGGYAKMSGSTPTYMFFLTDHLGSVRVVANQSGTVLQTNQYSPFGDLINDANVAEVASDNRYRFTGKEHSAETLLHDFGARYLDTSVGRFTTIDPLAEKYPAISPYAYCAGDHVNWVDLDGCKIVPDGSAKFIEQFNEVRMWLTENGCTDILDYIDNRSSVTITISEGEENRFIKNSRNKRTGELIRGELQWNPNRFILTSEDILLSPTVALMHEFKHIYDQMIDHEQFTSDLKDDGTAYHNIAERNAIQFETMVARKLGEIPSDAVTRTTHSGSLERSTTGYSPKQQSTIASRYNDPNKLKRPKVPYIGIKL